MADTRTHTDEFSSEFRAFREEEKAFIRDFISSQRTRGGEVKAAFALMEEAQKPSKTQNVIDLLFSVGSGIDLIRGGRNNAGANNESIDNYLKEGRSRRAERKTNARNQLEDRLNLLQFSGDVSSRNLEALLEGVGRRRGDFEAGIKRRFDVAEEGREIAESKAGIDLKKAQEIALGKEKKGKPGATQAEIDAANKEALSKLAGVIHKRVIDMIGKHDPNLETPEEWQGRYDVRTEIEWQRENKLRNPPKPRPKVGFRQTIDDFSFKNIDISDFDQGQSNPFDRKPAEGEFRGPFVPEQGAFDILKSLPSHLVESFREFFSRDRLKEKGPIQR